MTSLNNASGTALGVTECACDNAEIGILVLKRLEMGTEVSTAVTLLGTAWTDGKEFLATACTIVVKELTKSVNKFPLAGSPVFTVE